MYLKISENSSYSACNPYLAHALHHIWFAVHVYLTLVPSLQAWKYHRDCPQAHSTPPGVVPYSMLSAHLRNNWNILKAITLHTGLFRFNFINNWISSKYVCFQYHVSYKRWPKLDIFARQMRTCYMNDKNPISLGHLAVCTSITLLTQVKQNVQHFWWFSL